MGELMDEAAIEDRVKEIISEQMGVDKSEVTRDTNYSIDLNADSLDAVELIMEFEDEFNISISDEDAEKLKTVGDTITYLTGRVGEAHA
jgi:acyl carrier protein